MDIFCTLKTKLAGKVWSCNMKDIVLEPPAEFWNIDNTIWQSWKIYQLHPVNLPTINLSDK